MKDQLISKIRAAGVYSQSKGNQQKVGTENFEQCIAWQV